MHESPFNLKHGDYKGISKDQLVPGARFRGLGINVRIMAVTLEESEPNIVCAVESVFDENQEDIRTYSEEKLLSRLNKHRCEQVIE